MTWLLKEWFEFMDMMAGAALGLLIVLAIYLIVKVANHLRFWE